MTNTNQVPATWFAGDAGIRRLALQSDGPVQRGRCRFFRPTFWAVSADQLQCPADQPFGISETLFGFRDRRSEIVAPGWNSERTDLGELLPIPLYVFGDDRQGRGNRVVHDVSLAPPNAQIEAPSLAELSIS